MKGLLIKDFKLMKNMRTTMVIILLSALGMSFYVSDNLSFIVAYMALVGSSFTSSTISYDEFENGDAFLFSLPVSRKDYVVEKYLLSLLMCGGGWLLGAVFSMGAQVIMNGLNPMDGIMTALMLLPVVIGFTVFTLPLRLKFEGEKSRIVTIIVMGGTFLIVGAGAKIAEMLDIDLGALVERIPVMSAGMGIAVALGISIALLILSCRISIKIMEHKEF